MVQILPAVESFGSQLGQNLGQGLSQAMQFAAQMKMQKGQEAKNQEKMDKILDEENRFLEENYGIKLSGIKNPELRKSIIEQKLKGELENRKFKDEQQQKLIPYQSGLETVNQMRNLREKGNLGRLSSITGLLDEDTRRDRGEYEQLGKSLIRHATGGGMKIQNKAEFETLAHKLFDPNITDAEAEGILNGIEDVIKRSMQQYGPNQESNFSEKLQQPIQENKKQNRTSLMDIWGIK